MRSVLVLLKKKGRGQEGTLVSLQGMGQSKEAPSDEGRAWQSGS